MRTPQRQHFYRRPTEALPDCRVAARVRSEVDGFDIPKGSFGVSLNVIGAPR